MPNADEPITARPDGWRAAAVSRTMPHVETPRILVIGGTGKAGGAAVAALAAEGIDATVAARRPPPGGIALDLEDAAAVEAAARGHAAVYLQTPICPREAEIGTGAVAALRRAGVRKIVYLAVMNAGGHMGAIPHVATKLPVMAAVLDAGGVVLGPNFFFQNDLMMLPAILHGGVLPLPVGAVGINSVDTGDIGRAAANALLRDDWNGQAVPLCGAERLTGPMMAATWSAALGRPVAYPGDDIAPFVEALARVVPGFGDWERDDFRIMMEVTQAQGCLATEAEIAASTAIIGRPPRRYADFVAEHAGAAR